MSSGGSVYKNISPGTNHIFFGVIMRNRKRRRAVKKKKNVCMNDCTSYVRKRKTERGNMILFLTVPANVYSVMAAVSRKGFTIFNFHSNFVLYFLQERSCCEELFKGEITSLAARLHLCSGAHSTKWAMWSLSRYLNFSLFLCYWSTAKCCHVVHCIIYV